MIYMSGGSVLILLYFITLDRKRAKREKRKYRGADEGVVEGENNDGVELSINTDPLGEDGPGIAQLTNVRTLDATALQRDQHLLTSSLTGHMMAMPTSSNADVTMSDDTSESASSSSGSDSGVRLRKSTNNTVTELTNQETAEAEEEEIVHYISLNMQTASVAHEGTNYYLKFGCIGKDFRNFLSRK